MASLILVIDGDNKPAWINPDQVQFLRWHRDPRKCWVAFIGKEQVELNHSLMTIAEAINGTKTLKVPPSV